MRKGGINCGYIDVYKYKIEKSEQPSGKCHVLSTLGVEFESLIVWSKLKSIYSFNLFRRGKRINTFNYIQRDA